MQESQSHADIVDDLAEEFIARYRRGERPPVSEFAARCPGRADEIRELFPALVVMEQAVRDDTDEHRDAEHHQPLAPSKLGDFRIIREVGRGGMGIVYEAEQVSLGRRVALKVLPKQALLDSKHQRRFLREAKAAASLHHTNIVPVFGVGEQDGLHYYVMQFIHGLGLDEVLVELQRLREASVAERAEGQAARVKGAAREVSAVSVAQSLVSGRFERTLLVDSDSADDPSSAVSDHQTATTPPSRSTPNSQRSTTAHTDTVVGQLSDTLPGHAERSSSAHSRTVYWHSVARIGLQAAQALQYAHDQGIIHRDIKPGNLLLDTRGSVWVTDFGLAKAADQQDLTNTGDLLGTLRYMAPEQFDGQADARSDVFSLGLTLYELLALKPAFDETERHKLVKQVTSGTPPRLRTLDAHMPRDLETIVHKAIDREPSHRYQTAGELAADLQRYLGDEPIRARWISPVTRFTRWCKRNPAVASLTTTIAVLLVTAAVVASIAAVKFEDLAAKAQRKSEEAQQHLELAREETSRANDESRRRTEALALVTEEQVRAESNLELALQALDAVYLDAIGTDKLLGDPVSRPAPGSPDFQPSVRSPLTDLEKELLRRGLSFYDQFSRQNAETPRAALQTAQAHYRVGLLQAALGDMESAQAAQRAAIQRFSALVQTDPSSENFTRLADAHDALARVVPEWETARQATQAAIDACTKAIERDDENAQLFKRRAGYRRRISEFVLAQSDAETACRLAPDNIHVLYAAAAIYRESLARSNTRRTRELMQRVLEIDPDFLPAHTELGLRDREERNYQSSLQHFDRAVELAPNNAGVFYGRAQARARSGDIEGAQADVERADELATGDDAWQAYGRARAYQEIGDYDEALKAFAVAESLMPTQRQVFHYRGNLHLQHRYYQKAIAEFTTELTIAPDSWATYKRLAEAHFHLGQFDNALADLQKALELNSTDTSTLVWIPPRVVAECPDEEFRRGLLKLAETAVERSSTPERARIDRIRLYTKLGEDDRIIREEIERDDESIHHTLYSYRHRAAAFFRLGQYDRALEDLRKAMEIAPDETQTLVQISPTEVAHITDDAFKNGLLSLADQAVAEAAQPSRARIHRAELLLALGDDDAADRDLEAAAELAADDADVQIQIAHFYRDRGLETDALRNFTAAIELETSNAGYWNQRGMCYHRQGRNALARDDYSRAIELDESVPAFWSNRALSHLNLREYEQAIDDASHAIELRPDHALALQWRVRARVALQQWAAAIADYSRLIELQPNKREHLLHRGRARLASGDDAGAQADFDAWLQPLNVAVEDDESDWATWNRRGVALTKLHRWDAALADFDKADELAPERPVIQQNRLVCLREQSRWSNAAEALNRIMELGAGNWRTDYELALCSLAAGDSSRYREACARILARTPATAAPLQATFAAWTCALAPDSVDDYESVLALASGTVEEAPDNDQFRNGLGAVLYRAGRHDEAVKQFMQLTTKQASSSGDGSSPAYTWYFLAMTHHALGNADDAIQWLSKANEWTERVLTDEVNPAPWNRKLTLELLRDEANSLIDTDGSDDIPGQNGEGELPRPPPSVSRSKMEDSK